MVKLSITAINTSVTVQDPRALTQNNGEQAVISVEAGDTKAVNMQWQQLERIASQLVELANLGFLTFAIDASDSPAFVQQADSIDNPSLDIVPAIAAAGSVGIDITGTNLTAGQVQATAQLVSGLGAGFVDINVTEPGYAGNEWDVVVVDSGGAGPAAATMAVVDGRNVITVDLVGVTRTCTQVAALIDAIAGVEATASGTATEDVLVQALQAFTGGIGTGLVITLAGVPCIINSIDLSGAPIEVINIDTPGLAGAGTAVATDVVKLRIRSDSKEDLASVTLG